jgi:hypothetical protein
MATFRPLPEVLGQLVGAFEVGCGRLVLLGLVTRLAVLPLLVIMAVALITTKWPMLAAQGSWHMAHEARTDWSMFLGSLFLLIVGAGPWSSVGVTQVGEHIWLVTFMQYDLGHFDDETCRSEPIENPFGSKVLPMCSE